MRVQEKLRDDHGVSIPYSTLTRIVREMGLRIKAPRRVGTYVFEPGEEMQHDTSPHRLMLGKRKFTAQCAVVVLGYSRRAYMQYYPYFTRLEAKTFLIEAFRYLHGACRRCTVDNTSVIVAGGSGPAAIIAPEMERFGEMFGFIFQPHVIGHADRKAHVERFFWYVEKNFLAGRRFQDWWDLNRQAADWCREIADNRFMRALGMSPLEAYIKEKPHLLRLPAYIPPVYRTIHRRVDGYGFVHLETNRYSVPEKYVGAKVEIHQYWDRIEVFGKQRLIAKHARAIGRRNRRISNPAHHTPLPARTGTPVKSAAEAALSGRCETLDNYIMLLKKRSRGRGEVKLRRLLALQRTYPAAAFLTAVEQAYYYGLTDLNRLEKLILANVLDDFFAIE